MSNRVDEALARFGLSAFRPGQREIIEAILCGRPTIAVLPTGAGKSLCYQLPAVAMEKLAVVVSPLISLMKDQVDAMAARGIPATYINSSVDSWERQERLAAAGKGRSGTARPPGTAVPVAVRSSFVGVKPDAGAVGGGAAGVVL